MPCSIHLDRLSKILFFSGRCAVTLIFCTHTLKESHVPHCETASGARPNGTHHGADHVWRRVWQRQAVSAVHARYRFQPPRVTQHHGRLHLPDLPDQRNLGLHEQPMLWSAWLTASTRIV